MPEPPVHSLVPRTLLKNQKYGLGTKLHLCSTFRPCDHSLNPSSSSQRPQVQPAHLVEQRTNLSSFSPENVQHLLEAFLSVFVGVLTLSKMSCLKDIDLWWPLRSIGGSGAGGGVNCSRCRGSSFLLFLRP